MTKTKANRVDKSAARRSRPTVAKDRGGKGDGMPTVISYLRYSSKGQIGNDSVRRQLAMSDEWAKKNGLAFDESIQDEHVSAFRGANAETGHLGSILRRIERNEITPGSILVVESLDRLSRQKPNYATALFLQIINSGVDIITLIGGERRFARDTLDMPTLMFAVMVLSQAGEESDKKSFRGRANWDKRRDLAKKGELYTKHLPSWLQLDDKGKIVVDKAKAASVKYVFDLALKGLGVNAISRRLNAEGIPTISGAKQWFTNYVTTLLRDGAPVGVKNICKHEGNKRIVVDTIADYYPRIVSNEVFEQAQAIISSRVQGTRGEPKQWTKGIFNGLLKDASGNSYRTFERYSTGEKIRYYAPYESLVAKRLYIRADILEQVILEQLVNYDFAAFIELEGDSGAAKRSDAAIKAAELNAVEKRIADIEAQLTESDAPVAALVKALNLLEPKRKVLAAEVKTLKSNAVLSDSAKFDASAERLHRFIMGENALVGGELDQTSKDEISGLLQQLVKRITLTTAREENEVGGFVQIETRRGDSIAFRFTYLLRQKTAAATIASLVVEQRPPVDETVAA